MGAKLRIGTVPYLNARPLVFGLYGGGEVTLLHDVPSQLARDLAGGNLDAALVPALVCAERPEYRVVPGVAIGSDGPVESVCLFCRRALPAVRTVAADRSSRTSAALLTILCRDKWRIDPRVETADMSDGVPAGFDAGLVIGDRALKLPRAEYDQVVDLGEAWKTLTGLPFVFAVWVVREGPAAARIGRLLAEARHAGLAALPDLARDAARDSGLPAERILSYWKRIRYDLGEREIAGLREFLRRAGAPGTPRFLDPT